MRALPEILSGCKVFPCIPNGKEPATRDGWKVASNDPAQIAEWQKINPEFNWAVATGPSGLFVIDVDPNGLDWWAKALERDPELKSAVDKAFQVKTPRGGLHIYFKGEGPSTASRIAEGIDTRGGFVRGEKIVSGGYVLLPGSRTSAGFYEELPGGEILHLPPVVQNIIPERKKTDTLGLEKNPDQDKPRNVQWAVDLLKNYVASDRVAKQGAGGNNLTFQVAASILDKAISPGLCVDLMLEHWNPHCSPPWDEWELEGVVKNAASYGEDTEKGVKGFLANEDAFANFVGQEFEPPKHEGATRDKLKWIHDYADNVRDPNWLIPGVLPAQGTGMLYGESGSYKSFIAIDMALCLAFGVAGQWGAPPVQNDVLFIAGEGPISTARKRWPAWMQANGVAERTAHRMILKPRVPFFSDSTGWEHIKQDLAELEAKPSLIVIDTLSRLMTGMDENSAKEAAMITDFMEQLAHYYECFVLAVHHTGKDKSRGARGSSVFHANLDVVLTTRKRQDGTEFRVIKQKDADVSDEVNYFKVEEAGQSIVLRRGAEIPPEIKNAGSSYKWASVEEVVAVLSGNLEGKTSTVHLVQEIAGKYGLSTDLVRAQLYKNEALRWLRPDNNRWEIPAQDYDL